MIINGKSAAAALVKARATIGATVVKDASANYGKYATLAAVMEAITPALAVNGLALVQEAELGDSAVTMAATLIHESGETIEFAPLTMPLGNVRTPQAVGSAMTYGRRYQLTALFGLAPDDDDGEAASKTPTDAPGRAVTPNREMVLPRPPDIPQRGQPITENTLKRLHALGKEAYGAQWDSKRPELVTAASQGAVTSSKDLTENEARKLIRGMEAKIAQQVQPDAALRQQAA